MEESSWTPIPAREAVEILASLQGCAPIHMMQAEEWICKSISSGAVFSTVECTQLYDAPKDDPQSEPKFLSPAPFQEFTGAMARHYMLGASASIREGLYLIKGIHQLRDDKQRGASVFGGNEFCWNGHDEDRTLDVWRRYESYGRDIICVGRNVHLYKEEMLWLIGAPGGKKPTEQPVKSNRGRPRKKGMEEALIHLIGISHSNGDGLIGLSQADISRMIANYFADNGIDEPAKSTIEDRAKQIFDVLPK